MATTKTVISVSSLTNQIVTRDAANIIQSISGTGTFDLLLESLSVFMEKQEQDSKITQAQYAQILTQSLPVVLNSAIDFIMKAQLTAAEIDKTKEEEQLVYVSRVEKDKEAALLGLDDAAAIARSLQNGTTIYSPVYTNGHYV